MKEIIFSAPNKEVLDSEAVRLGFANEDGSIITNGTFESGGGWFLNIVGTIYETSSETESVARPGYWGRLRINGDATLPTFSSAITQYVYSTELEGWTSDGSVVAPEYVNTVGVIA